MSIQQERDENESEFENPKIKGDLGNIFLLTYMYILQCVPRGLAQAIPLILQERKVTYTDQAGFSLSQYPYCLKMLWSPLVDAVYSKKIGRRKTWAIPSLFVIGLMLLLLALNLDDWLGSEDGIRRPKTQTLATVLFICIVFCSMLDIAVDAWALTMLKKRNVGHQASANNIGWSIGVFLGFVVFLMLGAKEFSNFFRSVPQDHGFVDFVDYILFWSILCLASTTLIWLFKRDNSLDFIKEVDESKLGLKKNYIHMWQILKLKPIQKAALIMLTHSIAFGPQIGVASLKLVDAGFSANTVAMLTNVPSLPFIIFAPYVFSRYVTGARCMRTFLIVYTIRLVLNILTAACVYTAPYVRNHEKNSFPTWYYWTVLIICNAELVMDCLMWTSSGALFCRVSDIRFGATYMTFFNVITHTGVRWTTSVSLWLVDLLTLRSCAEMKTQDADTCRVIFDGYFTEVVVCSLIGITWLYWARKEIYNLEKLSPSAWIVEPTPSVTKEQVLLTSCSQNE